MLSCVSILIVSPCFVLILALIPLSIIFIISWFFSSVYNLSDCFLPDYEMVHCGNACYRSSSFCFSDVYFLFYSLTDDSPIDFAKVLASVMPLSLWHFNWTHLLLYCIFICPSSQLRGILPLLWIYVITLHNIFLVSGPALWRFHLEFILS